MPDGFLMALAGGICIGLASAGLMILLGRIAGISGIVFSAANSPVSNLWALVFMAGLAAGAFLFHMGTGQPAPPIDVPLPLLLAGGLIVGFGTRLGSGCTSGHGICGLGRLSVRSMIATGTFMLFGFITVFVRLHGGIA